MQVCFTYSRDGEVLDSETYDSATSFDLEDVLERAGVHRIKYVYNNAEHVRNGSWWTYTLNDGDVVATLEEEAKHLRGNELALCYELISIAGSDCFNQMVVY